MKSILLKSIIFILLNILYSNYCCAQVVLSNAHNSIHNICLVNGTDTNSIYVYDYESILSDIEEKKINKLIDSLNRSEHKEIFVITTPSIGNFENIQSYAMNIGNIYSESAKKNDVIVLAISKTLRKIGIATSDTVRIAISDQECREIIDQQIVPDFKKEQFFTGINNGINELILNWE